MENRPKRTFSPTSRYFISVLAEQWKRERQRWLFWRYTLTLLLRNPLFVIGVVVILVMVFAALAHPLLMDTIWDSYIYDPMTGFDPDVSSHPSNPTTAHPLGTDALGRDVVSQVIFAARTSLGVGLLAGFTAVLISMTIGLIAAFYGGWIDNILMLIADTFLLMPPVLITLIVGLIIPLTWWSMGLLFGVLSGLGSLAITCKHQASTIRVKPYVDASKITGAGSLHIILKHMVPGMLSVVMVLLMFVVSQAILIEAMISFFQGTEARLSWGTMIWFIQSTFYLSPSSEQWLAILAPALAITFLSGAFYLLGRAMDQVLNKQLLER